MCELPPRRFHVFKQARNCNYMLKYIEAIYMMGINMPTLKPKKMIIKAHYEPPTKVIAEVGGIKLIQDLPKAIGGTGEGPTPTELLLASLAGCLGIVSAIHKNRFGVDIKSMEIEVSGLIDVRGFMGEDVKPGFTEVSAVIKVKSDAPEEDVKKLIEFVRKHCPIEDTIQSPTPVKVEVIKE